MFFVFFAAQYGMATAPSDLSPDTIRTQVQKAIAPVAQLLLEDSTGRLAQVHLNDQRLVSNVIQPYLYRGGLGSLRQKSAVRDARVAEVEGWLAPYESILIEAMQCSATRTSFPDAAVDLLMFARPSESLKLGLQEVAYSTKTKPDRAADAYHTLFALQLDDVGTRKQVLNVISWRQEQSIRASLGNQLLQRAGAEWGMSEMEPLYRDILNVAFVPKNYPTGGGRGALLAQYEAAIAGLALYGEDGSPFAELIKARVAEMNSKDADQAALVRDATETLEILTGKRAPKAAVNWKGQLLGVSKTVLPKWRSQHSESN